MAGWRGKGDVIGKRRRVARWIRFTCAGWQPALPAEVARLGGEDGGAL